MGTTTLDQSGLGSNGNKAVLHVPHGSRTGASSSDDLVSYIRIFVVEGVLPVYRDAVGTFYSSNWLGWSTLNINDLVALY